MAELLFHGAAEEVTGSMHMVRVDDRWVALDCGLYHGRRSEAEAKNRAWPVPPAEIAAVVVSHAHIDHTGRLPRLVADGFDGPIYATPATRDLCAIMLPDSAHIQEEDVKYINKRRKKNGLAPVEPLYDYRNARDAIGMIQSVPYQRWFEVVPGLLACFQEAGHMLGSAGIRLAFGKRDGETPSLYFTGDVGRPDKPIIRDPLPFPPAENYICECTYGARVSERVDDAKHVLTDVVARTAARRGKVIIPAFSVGRTQTIVYFLHEQMVAGHLPRLPIFVDSPLAVNATEVFRLHPECYDAEARAFHAVTGDILGGGYCTYIRDVEESKKLNTMPGPMIIISASGMCEAGRIRHHIANNVEDPACTLLFPGFQAAHTLGRRLVEGAEKIRLFHEDFSVNAEVVQLDGFSGHADQADLLRLLDAVRESARRIFLVHGEPDQTAIFADLLHERGFPHVQVVKPGDRVEI